MRVSHTEEARLRQSDARMLVQTLKVKQLCVSLLCKTEKLFSLYFICQVGFSLRLLYCRGEKLGKLISVVSVLIQHGECTSSWVFLEFASE